jgi:hypothetical protein
MMFISYFTIAIIKDLMPSPGRRLSGNYFSAASNSWTLESSTTANIRMDFPGHT